MVSKLVCRYVVGGARGGGREMRPMGSVPRVSEGWKKNKNRALVEKRNKKIENHSSIPMALYKYYVRGNGDTRE